MYIYLEFSLFYFPATRTQMHNKLLTLCTFFTVQLSFFLYIKLDMCCPSTPWLSRSFRGKSLVSLVFHARFSTLAFPATRLAQMQPKNSCTALRCRVCVRNKIIACEKLRVWELLQRAFAAAASASSSNKNNSRHFVVVYEQLWGAECPRRVSTVASCLARFVFREVRQQQQQHVLASLLACARYSAYAAASVDVSVARSTQCGRCQ